VEPLITADRVAAKGRVAVPKAGSPDLAALDNAVADATSLVMGHLRRETVDTLTPHAQGAIRAVAVRVALRMWRNPADANTESYEGMSHTWDARLLTGDEKEALSPHRSRHRGPIRLTPRLFGDQP
jgi:hypothetical protein